MADDVEASIFTHWFPKFETPGAAQEIKSACTMLCDDINGDSGALEILDSLLKKRRQNALQKKNEDASYLDFVDEEEKKIRQWLKRKKANQLAKAPTGGKRRRIEVPDFGFDELIEEGARIGAELRVLLDPGGFQEEQDEAGYDAVSQSQRDEFLLKDYLRASQDSLKQHLGRLTGNKKRIEALLRLIEKAENEDIVSENKNAAILKTIAEDIVIKDEVNGSAGRGGTHVPLGLTDPNKAKADRVNIAVLHEHLKQEKETHARNLKVIESEEKKITSYRRLIGEQII